MTRNELKNGKIIMVDRVDFEPDSKWPIIKNIERKIERIWPIRYRNDPFLDETSNHNMIKIDKSKLGAIQLMNTDDTMEEPEGINNV